MGGRGGGGAVLACVCVCVFDLVPCRKGHHLFMRFATLGEAWYRGLVLFVCVCVCVCVVECPAGRATTSL